MWEFVGEKGNKEAVCHLLKCNKITRFPIFENVWLFQYARYSFINTGTQILQKVK